MLGRIWRIFYRSWTQFSNDDGWAIASHIALSGLTSLFPFLILVGTLAGFIGTPDLAKRATDLLFESWPPQVAGPIAHEVERVLTQPRTGLATLSALLAVYFASSAVDAVRIGLNRAYDVTDARAWWVLRLESVFFVLLGAVALMGFTFLVVLEPIGAADLPAQAQAPRMDQEQQTFIPSVLVVRTGQPVDFLNHDDVLHNVRVRNDDTKASAFNVAIPTGEKYTHTFKDDGFYDVGCDIHPGMSAQIFSSTSPYVVLADDAGAFTIAGVPNGPYKAIAYAGAQKIEKEVSVSAGSGALDLTKP